MIAVLRRLSSFLPAAGWLGEGGALLASADVTAYTAIGAVALSIISGLAAIQRNRRTDKITLYGQLVDDLRQDVEEVRKQRTEDRAEYRETLEEKEKNIAALEERVDQLKSTLNAIDRRKTEPRPRAGGRRATDPPAKRIRKQP